MNRIKVSDNFYADEFLHPAIYQRIIDKNQDPRRYINPSVVKVSQKVRDLSNVVFDQPVSITINNWWGKDRKLDI